MAEPAFSGVDQKASEADELSRRIVQSSTTVSYQAFIAYGSLALFLVSWIPAIGSAARWACLGVLVALPIVAIVWWRNCRAIEKGDPLTVSTDPGWPDYQRARRTARIALVIWGLVLVAWLVQPAAGGWLAIRSLPSNPETLVVMKDTHGVYWAVLAGSIKERGLRTITTEEGALVGRASAKTGSPRDVAEELIEGWTSLAAQYPRGTGRVFGPTSRSWHTRQQTSNVVVLETDGSVSRSQEPVSIAVSELVVTREPR